MDNYGEVLERTSEILKSVRGSYDDMRFKDAMVAYRELGKMYAEYMGLDDRCAGVIQYLLESVAINR